MRRLSGGNQQKVTIARWIAGGVQTLLCFDPTRGIDIRTKRQIYHLLRELAEAGAAVLLYTSELEEVQLACDRAVVIFGGRVVAEMPADEADEPTLMRRGLRARPSRGAADRGGGERGVSTAAQVAGTSERWADALARRCAGSCVATPGSSGSGCCWPACSCSRRSSSPTTGRPPSRSSRSRRCPTRSRRRARSMAIIAGGVDLSLAAMMALISVSAASLMEGRGDECGRHRGRRSTLLLGVVLGAINGLAVVLTRVPDIVVTLAFFFIWEGAALLVLDIAGRRAPRAGCSELVTGTLGGSPLPAALTDWAPKALVLMVIAIGIVVDPAAAFSPWIVDVRGRVGPPGGLPERRAGPAHEGGVLCPGRPVRGDGRPRRSR